MSFCFEIEAHIITAKLLEFWFGKFQILKYLQKSKSDHETHRKINLVHRLKIV